MVLSFVAIIHTKIATSPHLGVTVNGRHYMYHDVKIFGFKSINAINAASHHALVWSHLSIGHSHVTYAVCRFDWYA